jgi:cell division protein FtsZ
MSLMEVNDASCVIQEAAHDEANIIFGAVIDPNLSGKIKITVIATGFERGASYHMPAAALPTPTDLNNYTTHLAQRAEPVHVEPVMQAPAPAIEGMAREAAESFTVSRRTAIELPALPLRSAAANRSAVAEENGFDLSSTLEIPAFLRRQN